MRAVTVLLVTAALAAAATAAYTATWYSFDDAVREVAPDGGGVDTAIMYVEALSKAANKLGLEARAGRALDFVGDSLSNFTLLNLYESEFSRDLENGYRGVAVTGLHDDREYRVKLEDTPFEEVRRHGFGSMVARFGLKPAGGTPAGHPTYSGRMEFQVTTKNVSQKTHCLFQDGLLKVISPDNIRALNRRRIQETKHIKVEALQVIYELCTKFPDFAATLQSYMYILHTEIVRDKELGEEYTRLTLRAFFMLDAMRKDYPNLAEYLDHFRNLYNMHLVFRNSAGHVLGDFTASSQGDVVTLHMYTRDGRVIPWDGEGRPLFDEEFSFSELADFPFEVEAESLVNVYGIRFATDRILVRGRFTNRPGKGALDLRLAEVSPTRIFGRAAQVVPKWVIELALPTNMEDLVHESTERMVNANGGTGTFLNLSWDTTDPGDVCFRMEGESEFVDSFYTKFSMATLKYCFRTSGETREEMKQLTVRVLTNILLDLRRLKNGTETCGARAAGGAA